MNDEMDNQSKKQEIHQLFLIRGLARESRHWGDFVADLETAYSATGRKVRVETIDLPGCGRHSEMRSCTTVRETADFAREKMKEILAKEAQAGTEPAAHRRLVSISLGGMVGVSWMARYPHDFHSAVLINSSFRGLSKFTQRLRWDSWWRIPLIVGERSIVEREKKILDWVSNRTDRRQEVLDSWVQIQLTRPVSPLNLALQLTAASVFKAPVTSDENAVLPKLLLLCSRQDRMVHPDCSQAIADLYKAPVIFHPTAGHDLPLDAGPWVATMISEW
ncbi:MAG: alpha/beta hydrolase [Deltaproteobacteria bacterium]|nr:alpha/beta hydrolase [Deltaproteobacteria bacterium]